jgi:protein gp37
MSRLMSVSFTEQAVIERRKTVTRRKGWTFLKPGDRLTLCRKVMGRKGAPLVRLAEVEVVDVRRQRLDLLVPKPLSTALGPTGRPPASASSPHDRRPTMSDKTKIEWTDATWNPVTGCTKISEGCDHCYIDRTPPFRIEGRQFVLHCPRCAGHGIIDAAQHACPDCTDGTVRGATVGATTGVRLHPERLDQPLRWQRPRRVFVNSLSDLFHADVPDEFIARVFAVMAYAYQHTFQVLTKRPARMRSLLRSQAFLDLVSDRLTDMISDGVHLRGVPLRVEQLSGRRGDNLWHPGRWPLPNVWLGTSVENQRWADIRIPQLMETPAAVRFLSCEPLLGPVDLTGSGTAQTYWLTGRPGWGPEEVVGNGYVVQPLTIAPSLDWVIVGGESGPGARPMHLDWARSLRDQCTGAGIAFHFKQWGEWAPYGVGAGSAYNEHPYRYIGDPITSPPWDDRLPGRRVVKRVGKRAAGRELDGRTWDEYPAARQERP